MQNNSKNALKVFVNKNITGALNFENDTYIFNYKDDATDIVSLTMPKRSASWNSKKLHPIFQMNMPEGALKETIKNHFSKIETMTDINMLKILALIGATITMALGLEIPKNHIVNTSWLEKNHNDSKLVIIDTREKIDYEKGHIKMQ